KFSVGGLKPTKDAWASGERTVRCGLQSVSASHKLVAFTGPVKGQDQSNVHDAGTCLALNGKGIGEGVGDVVPCAAAHARENIGVADLGTAFTDVLPSPDQQNGTLAGACNTILGQYAPGQDPAAKG